MWAASTKRCSAARCTVWTRRWAAPASWTTTRSSPMDAAEIDKLARLEQRHWWYAERRTLLHRILRDHRTGGWAADIGAAAGGNTRVLESLGWRTLALEYSQTGAELTRSRGLQVSRADAHDLPLRD